MRIALVVAAARNDIIGRDGGLPWHLPADLARFRALTLGNVVVMGRSTHESISARLGHPLPGRLSVVASRSATGAEGAALIVSSVDEALRVAAEISSFAGREELSVVGGATVYEQTLDLADVIYLTRIDSDVPGDTRMPADWLEGFVLAAEEPPRVEGGLPYVFQRYERSTRG